MGKLLPSNVALEFSLQFRSVIVFGEARLIINQEEARRVMYGLIHKYFPAMTAGKENWKDRADQSDEWPALDESWFS